MFQGTPGSGVPPLELPLMRQGVIKATELSTDTEVGALLAISTETGSQGVHSGLGRTGRRRIRHSAAALRGRRRRKGAALDVADGRRPALEPVDVIKGRTYQRLKPQLLGVSATERPSGGPGLWTAAPVRQLIPWNLME